MWRRGARIPALSLLLAAACGEARDARMGDYLRVSPVRADESAVTVCAAGATLRGVDVSKWNGAVDWAKVAAAGMAYAFVRVSDGTTYPDGYFAANWAGTLAHGIRRGVYQFFRSDEDPVAQADLLLRAMGPLMPGDLPPVADVETNDGQSAAVVAANLARWLERVESALGVQAIIYTGPSFWDTYVKSTAFSDHPLWVAHYEVSCPRLPAAWHDWLFWQSGATGTVDGIDNGYVDTDVFNGGAALLEAHLAPPPVCGDGRCAGGEAHATCPLDCAGCDAVPAAGRVIDDTDLCFTAGGDPKYIRTVSGSGYDGVLKWTKSWVTTQPENYGLWQLSFAEAGIYRLEAYLTSDYADWTEAPYQVRHQGTTDIARVDQTSDGWVTLGDYAFAAGGEQWVRLDDAVSSAAAAGLRIVLDAIRLTRLDASAPVTPPSPPDPGTQASSTSAVAKPDEETPSVRAGDCAAGACPEVSADEEAGSVGRSCRSVDSGAAGVLVVIGLLALAGRRRSCKTER